MIKIIRKYIPMLVLLFVSNTLYTQYSVKDFAVLHGLAGSWKMVTQKGFYMSTGILAMILHCTIKVTW